MDTPVLADRSKLTLAMSGHWMHQEGEPIGMDGERKSKELVLSTRFEDGDDNDGQ